ncbi:MAG: DUF5606 domain-containing protein [Flavobacteriales bacterium]
MNLTGIISISGRPGLFKVIAQGKNSVIVESMIDKKRFPAYATEKISTLEDISIFTYEEDVKLTEVLAKMNETFTDNCPAHKEDMNVLVKALDSFLPNWDQDRVYPSDVRKIFQWFHLIKQAGLFEASEEESTEAPAKEAKAKTEPAKKKASTAAAPAKAAKPANVKKAAPVKTGSSRGK